MTRATAVLSVWGGLWLTPGMPAQEALTHCQEWNTEEFFRTATVESVTACLEAGAQPNTRNKGQRTRTPLHWAAGYNQNPEVIEALLAAGADPNAETTDKWTPLHAGAEKGNLVAIQALLDAGADANARTDWAGMSPLHLAAQRQNLAVIQALLAAGAYVDGEGTGGYTPLSLAVNDGNVAVIKVLLGAGADPMKHIWGSGAGGGDSSTPLDDAIRSANSLVVEILQAAVKSAGRAFCKIAEVADFGVWGPRRWAGWKQVHSLLDDGSSQPSHLGNGERTCPQRHPITVLGELPARAVPVAGRGTRPAQRAAQALGAGAGVRACRRTAAGHAGQRGGSPAGEPGRPGAGLSGQGGVRCAHDAVAGRSAAQRPDPASAVRLGAGARCPARRRSRGPSRASTRVSWPGTCTMAWSSGRCGSLGRDVSRDSTAIPVRETPVRKSKPVKQKRKRGRPRKGEERPPEPTRLERQGSMTLEELLADLPTVCDTGVKRNAKGYQESWNGYKLHIDAIDGGIPVRLLTSASLHDSQAAIPLAKLTAGRVDNLYDLMDSAYGGGDPGLQRAPGACGADRSQPAAGCAEEGGVEAGSAGAAQHRAIDAAGAGYHERSTVERVNGRLKDEFAPPPTQKVTLGSETSLDEFGQFAARRTVTF